MQIHAKTELLEEADYWLCLFDVIGRMFLIIIALNHLSNLAIEQNIPIKWWFQYTGLLAIVWTLVPIIQYYVQKSMTESYIN